MTASSDIHINMAWSVRLKIVSLLKAYHNILDREQNIILSGLMIKPTNNGYYDINNMYKK